MQGTDAHGDMTICVQLAYRDDWGDRSARENPESFLSVLGLGKSDTNREHEGHRNRPRGDSC